MNKVTVSCEGVVKGEGEGEGEQFALVSELRHGREGSQYIPVCITPCTFPWLKIGTNTNNNYADLSLGQTWKTPLPVGRSRSSLLHFSVGSCIIVLVET